MYAIRSYYVDYGRYKYERKKKQGKNKGHTASLKEVKLRPRTDQHDLDFVITSYSIHYTKLYEPCFFLRSYL